MDHNFRIEMAVSESIAYMRRRLSAEQAPSIDVQLKVFEELDKMIEHIRSRLKPSLQEP